MFSLSTTRRMVATFVKTDSPQIVEILGLCGLDFVVLDAEHAPFDRQTMDRMLLAARAAGLPMLVRLPDQRDASILSALDLGASGIILPHVDGPDQAREAVAAARFIGGRRGLSLSARFAAYGTTPRDQAIREADQSPVICQIESRAAVEAVEAIAGVPGLGGLLIGRSDLALSLGVADPGAPVVARAVERIIAAAQAHALPVVIACGTTKEAAAFAAQGAHAFIIGSDQSLLRSAASLLRPALS